MESYRGINTLFVVAQRADEFQDLSDLQVPAGLVLLESGGGNSCRAAKCLIKYSCLDFTGLCKHRDQSSPASVGGL